MLQTSAYKCPRTEPFRCGNKKDNVIISICPLCGQHLHLECKECGYHWNEWVILNKDTCCGDVDRYP